MARYDRYDDDSRLRSRGRDDDYYDRDRGRGGGMFDFGRRDRDDDRGSFRGRDERGSFRDRDDDRGRFERERGGRGERHYGSDDLNRGLPMDETSRLIASNKVEGTTVYGRDGHRLGTIFNFMVDKFSGKVQYAVMRYGGFLGMGERYYPLPWRELSYDTRAGGYRIELTERDLEHAPSFDRSDEPRFNEDYSDRVDRWYSRR